MSFQALDRKGVIGKGALLLNTIKKLMKWTSRVIDMPKLKKNKREVGLKNVSAERLFINVHTFVARSIDAKPR